jgi:DNA (cytosine-5)-methyltransferase 1
MFAGIGGICLGLKQAGCEIVWANEKDHAACKTYRYNFGEAYLHECDIKRVAADSLPDFEILTAGFPCQPFSIAGAQKGFDDPAGNLFLDIARIAEAKSPKVIFLENVSNLIKHDNGRTFLVICNTLIQLGYTIKYRVMGAHVYGNLPQPRIRIYIVAFRNHDDCDSFMFPESIDLTIAINDIVHRNEQKNKINYYSNDSNVVSKYGNKIIDRNYIYRISDKGLIRVSNHFCPTLTANMGYYPDRVPLVCDDFGIRKLTLRECLDFQGFPFDFRFPKTITMNDAYRQIGNSVCVPVIRRIAEKIRDTLI